MARGPRWIGRGLIALVAVVGVRGAGAWEFYEHAPLGADAYREACADLVNGLLITDALRPYAGVACGDDLSVAAAEVIAERFGQATALAGDHLARPEDFDDLRAPDRSESLLHFVGLALENESHFLPTAFKVWRRYHQRAVARAIAARQLRGLALQQAFEQAFHDQAFADHFLQDAFSAGHAGFARMASRPSIAGSFHDYFNVAGRMFIDGRGRTWVGYGDKLLDAPKNQYAREIVRAAGRASVRAFLVAFVTGVVDDQEELSIAARFPVAASALAQADCEFGTDGTIARCDYKDALAPTMAIQRSAQPGIEVGIGYRGAIGRRGNVPLIGTFGMTRWGRRLGFRLEYAFGAVRDGDTRSQGLLGLGLGVEAPVYSRFPTPVALSVVAGGSGAVVFGAHDDEGQAVGSYLEVRVGPKLAVDVHKGWSVALAGGVGYARSAMDQAQVRTPDGRGWWWSASLERIVATQGGGAR